MGKLKLLLRIKYWQLFCLFITFFLSTEIDFYKSFISPVILTTWFLWVVSIAYNGQDFIDSSLTKNLLTRKKISILVYSVLVTFPILLFLPNENKIEQNDIILFVVIALKLIFIYCFGYILITAAIVVKIIEFKKKADFSSSFGHFLRLLVFPLGVYGIQKILNKEFK